MHRQAIGVCLTLWMYAGNMLSQSGANIRFTGPTHGSFSRHSSRGQFFSGIPYWTDYLPPSETAPSVIVVQPPAPAVTSPMKPEEPKSSAPLMIEWQGDRYVRRSSTQNSRADQPDYIADDTRSRPAADRIHRDAKLSYRGVAKSAKVGTQGFEEEPKSQLPTTFIFRDGHHEQSTDYSIISGVIYARGDYWATGQWSKQIRVADLDIPATIQVNEVAGIRFRLPRAANEVVTRP
jgi:hypothetical protein